MDVPKPQELYDEMQHALKYKNDMSDYNNFTDDDTHGEGGAFVLA